MNYDSNREPFGRVFNTYPSLEPSGYGYLLFYHIGSHSGRYVIIVNAWTFRARDMGVSDTKGLRL